MVCARAWEHYLQSKHYFTWIASLFEDDAMMEWLEGEGGQEGLVLPCTLTLFDLTDFSELIALQDFSMTLCKAYLYLPWGSTQVFC